MNQYPLDDLRLQIQASLIEAKKDQLREQFGLEATGGIVPLPPEIENEWLDHILNFERQFENAAVISVRDRIGDPPVQSAEAVSPESLAETVDALLDLLAEHGIVIDFMGEWTDDDAYCFIVEELFDEEIRDVRLDGLFAHFEAMTPEYEVQMWAELFTSELLSQERDGLLHCVDKQLWLDAEGNPRSPDAVRHQMEAVWAHVSPVTDSIDVQALATEVNAEDASVTARIAWRAGSRRRQVESYFRLQPSPLYGWDVVYTTLFDDLLALAAW